MLRAFAVLLVCQLAGEVVGRALALPIPGPVLGLVLLAAGLGLASRHGWVTPAEIESTALGRTASGLLAVLGILFVPAGVGIIQQFGLLGQYGLALPPRACWRFSGYYLCQPASASSSNSACSGSTVWHFCWPW